MSPPGASTRFRVRADLRWRPAGSRVSVRYAGQADVALCARSRAWFSESAAHDRDRDEPDRDGDELAEDVQDCVAGDEWAGGQLTAHPGEGDAPAPGRRAVTVEKLAPARSLGLPSLAANGAGPNALHVG